jgi:hypothetical protein
MTFSKSKNNFQHMLEPWLRRRPISRARRAATYHPRAKQRVFHVSLSHLSLSDELAGYTPLGYSQWIVSYSKIQNYHITFLGFEFLGRRNSKLVRPLTL